VGDKGRIAQCKESAAHLDRRFVVKGHTHRPAMRLFFSNRNLQESTMNQRLIVSSAVASALALGLVGQVAAQDKEKCFGVAKAGANDCASATGSHSCAGQAKVDNDPAEWKYVAKGTCKEMKGLSAEEAKKKIAEKKK
jgi:uncharacterized membrane protein